MPAGATEAKLCVRMNVYFDSTASFWGPSWTRVGYVTEGVGTCDSILFGLKKM